eukprot:3967844-Prorocentrum_lima.AAC.1
MRVGFRWSIHCRLVPPPVDFHLRLGRVWHIVPAKGVVHLRAEAPGVIRLRHRFGPRMGSMRRDAPRAPFPHCHLGP